MIMTRGKDDPDELYEMLGTKEYRKEPTVSLKTPSQFQDRHRGGYVAYRI